MLRLITGMGGGYGDPRERAAEAVGGDVRNGFLTSEEADAVYGLGANWPSVRFRLGLAVTSLIHLRACGTNYSWGGV